jgi:hypothetical protein
LAQEVGHLLCKSKKKKKKKKTSITEYLGKGQYKIIYIPPPLKLKENILSSNEGETDDRVHLREKSFC